MDDIAAFTSPRHFHEVRGGDVWLYLKNSSGFLFEGCLFENFSDGDDAPIRVTGLKLFK